MNQGIIITGKVAKILNSREVAITVGSAEGVQAGLYFNVFRPRPIDVIDPDTRKSLGVIDEAKIRLITDRVYDHFSILRTYNISSENVGGSNGLSAIARSFLPPRYVYKAQTLKNENGFDELSEEDSIVKVGDIVRSCCSENP